MARRRRRTASAARTIVVRTPRPTAPVVKYRRRRSSPVRRRRGGRRRGGGGSMLGGLVPNQAVQLGIGGLAYGFAVKSGWVQKLPAIPIVGRTGTAAILLNWAARRGMGGDVVRNAGLAAACLAGYQLGSTGSIVGDHFATSGYDDGMDGEEYDETLDTSG